MGWIAFLKRFTRSTSNSAQTTDVVCDPGGGTNLTGQHFGAPGDDASPLDGDYVALVPTQRTGGVSAVGYIDPKNAGKTNAGGKRIYARDADGTVIAELWLKNDANIELMNEDVSLKLNADGSASLSNSSGQVTLEAGGDVDINGVKIDTSGNIACPSSITADADISADGKMQAPSIKVDGKELKNHTHGGVTSGNSPTGPNL